MDDSLAARQFGLGEVAGTAFAHGEERAAIDGGIELKPEEIGAALTEEVQHADVVVDRLAGLRQRVVKRDDRVEQPVTREALRLEVDPQPARQKEVGLSRLDGDARRNATAVEIPRAGMNVVLGDDSPRSHRPRLALNGQDAIHEHQWFIRQTDSRRVLVDLGEHRPEHFADPADGERQALVAVEGTRGSGARAEGRGWSGKVEWFFSCPLSTRLGGERVRVRGSSFHRMCWIGSALTVWPPHPNPLPRRRGRGDKSSRRSGAGQCGEVLGGQPFGAGREAKECLVSLRAVVGHESKQLEGGMVEGRGLKVEGQTLFISGSRLREQIVDFNGRCAELPAVWRRRNLERQSADARDDLANRRCLFSGSQLSPLDHQPIAIQGRQVHRNSLGDQGREEFEERLDGTRRVGQGGSREMRSVTENLVDHPGAGRAGADLDEDSHAIGIRPFDDARKVDRVHRLSDDGLGRRFARERILVAPRRTVKVDRGRLRVEG